MLGLQPAATHAEPFAAPRIVSAERVRVLWERSLKIPLSAKLLGANSLIAFGALLAFAAWGDAGAIVLMSVVLAVSLAVNTLLVRVAMRPLDLVENVAQRVSDGDFSARVTPSVVADDRMTRVGAVINRLLDRVMSDRVRIHELVGQCLRTREVERENMARELRDATAQQLYGLSLQLATAVRQSKDPELTEVLATARDISVALVDDVRLFAESVYPGLLGKFGLSPAIQMIARSAAHRSSMDVTAAVDACTAPIPPVLAAALYRVAEDCVQNVERHAQATTLRLTLTCDGHAVQLEVVDDGAGFDVAAAERSSAGVGLFRARELLEHAGGTLTIASVPGGGTRVAARATLVPPRL